MGHTQKFPAQRIHFLPQRSDDYLEVLVLYVADYLKWVMIGQLLNSPECYPLLFQILASTVMTI